MPLLPSLPPDSPSPGRCSQCPGNCVWLRWRSALLLHLDQKQIGSALECLCQVMDEPACPFFLGPDSICASHGPDGCYYLMCPGNLILKLSKDDAHCFREELLFAQARLGGEPQSETLSP